MIIHLYEPANFSYDDLISGKAQATLENNRQCFIDFFKIKTKWELSTILDNINNFIEAFHREQIKRGERDNILNTFCESLINPEKCQDFYTLLQDPKVGTSVRCSNFACGGLDWDPYLKFSWAVFRSNILAQEDNLSGETITKDYVKKLLVQIRFRCAPFVDHKLIRTQWRTVGSHTFKDAPAPDSGSTPQLDLSKSWGVLRRNEIKDKRSFAVVGADGHIIARLEEHKAGSKTIAIKFHSRTSNISIPKRYPRAPVFERIRRIAKEYDTTKKICAEFQPFRYSSLKDNNHHNHSIPIYGSDYIADQIPYIEIEGKMLSSLPWTCALARIAFSKAIRAEEEQKEETNYASSNKTNKTAKKQR